MPYAYQGDNCYGRGDYYQGDYYQGDPGIFKSIGKFLGGAAKGFLTGGPLGAITGGVGGLLKARPMQLEQAPVLLAPPPTFAQSQFGVQTGLVNIGRFGPPTQGPVGTMTRGGFVPGLCDLKGTRPNKSSYFRADPNDRSRGVLIPKGSVCVTTRRLNVANPRALRRSIRRVAGFAKLARRSIRWVSAKPPKGRPVAKRRGR